MQPLLVDPTPNVNTYDRHEAAADLSGGGSYDLEGRWLSKMSDEVESGSSGRQQPPAPGSRSPASYCCHGESLTGTAVGPAEEDEGKQATRGHRSFHLRATLHRP